MAPAIRRSIVYVDGFNVYYGALRGGPHKWLDLQRYFKLLRPHDAIQRIRYFTALVDGSAKANQALYLRALETLPLIDTILGKFKTKQIQCRHSGCTLAAPRFFRNRSHPAHTRKPY